MASCGVIPIDPAPTSQRTDTPPVPVPVPCGRWAAGTASQPRAHGAPVPVRSCQPLALRVRLKTDLAGVCPRLLKVSRTDHGLVDHVVVESVRVALSVGDQLDLGV